ncbi:glucosamine--fructose-6-phosphate aminotransferase (isomerizing) [Paracoccus isoporae]|uniref:Glucosamine--fructose-6-phosphate aminotransferase (Isomerizing) n=1 Tax=Paracoccus isoporae TaxID=591205 RepID=A0A1G7B7K8_9RHOB|nr:SIS domain-containing protein [Paracoccus isoporae]SDE23021.1 glucosamine--fructose-6-phosphate aminotransferase (isomerizing) [Paracoccus isoporae]
MTQSHMAREVAEIPDAVARFLDQSRDAVGRAAEGLRARDPAVLTTVARGSSDHAATYLKYAIELQAGIPVASVGPSVASIYKRPLRLERAGCIGISQSGQSPDIVDMIRAAGDGGALSIAITNHADSPMAQSSAHCLALHAGEEKSVAATKTFVNSVVAGLSLLAEWREDGDLRAAVAALPDAFAQSVAMDWSPLSDRLARAASAYVLGRGPGNAIANEVALKLKETSGTHAEAYSSAEVLHGPSAIVQANFPVLALGVEDAALPHVVATAERLAEQGADVFLTGADAKGATRLPAVSGLHPMVAPLVLIGSFYACVEGLARRRGFDPDTPPHLRKVTETV